MLNMCSGSRWFTGHPLAELILAIGLSLSCWAALAQTPLAKRLRSLPFKIAYETYTNDELGPGANGASRRELPELADVAAPGALWVHHQFTPMSGICLEVPGWFESSARHG